MTREQEVKKWIKDLGIERVKQAVIEVLSSPAKKTIKN